MIYALFNPTSGVLTFSNAGVPLPLLVSTEGCRSLGEGGFPSGLFADASYEIHSVNLLPGDAVLFATDGLHEMRNAQEEDLSWGRLEEIWKHCRCKSADDCLDFLLDAVRDFSASSGSHDDITTVVLKVPLLRQPRDAFPLRVFLKRRISAVPTRCHHEWRMRARVFRRPAAVK
jgi:phosphoserine phosphatase RsbU/P